ncbi:MAG: iron-sulfur cluster biosynthesis transcriptional regulator SufR [Synechococcales cyanobacterium RU_4_20]|nr:iron-sulfur cluster biosynthesis transcriptional regulator SufR [Synechococcales cyanobacterium RU_4_20]NJR68174.1 iron-sulfur cluster biosynthesis transcriptional regulator SufR [Synechococcales cyanobacterium CRU_2_2]
MSVTQASTTKEDILQHLLKQGDATAQDLATAAEVSPQAIRRHLKDLELEDLIVHQAVQVKVGRPQYRYRLSKKGRSHFPDSYDRFAVSLLDTLSETVPPEQFRDILKTQWDKKIEEYRDRISNGTLHDRLLKLAELRRAEGFMSEVSPLDRKLHQLADADSLLAGQVEGFVVTEYNCAIANIAESFPTVCGHELELFTVLFPDCQVKRTHWMIRGQNYCGYLIQAENAPC